MQDMLQFAVIATTFTAACNLLESGNVYIDTESKSAISTICARDASQLSLWEQYQCEYIHGRDGYQKCWPQRRMSTCDPGKLKGLAVLYHGFSACPDQYNDFAPKLQAECWNVYLITSQGHGLNFCPTDSTASGCVPSFLNETQLNAKYGSDQHHWTYNVSTMPDTRQPWIDFVDRMIAMIEDEVAITKECEQLANSGYDADGLEVITGGLSFGAALAAGTVVQSGLNSVITKHVLMSPFFGISAGAIDNALYKCLYNAEVFHDCLPLWFEGLGFELSDGDAETMRDMFVTVLSTFVDTEKLDTSVETFRLLVRYLLAWIVENPDSIPTEKAKAQVYEVFDINMPWGAQCEYDIVERDRGGFCQFKVRQLLAAHSFGNYIVESLRDTSLIDQSIETLLILVERDGPTRNSLVVDYLRKFYGNEQLLIQTKSTNCMWFIAQECQDASWTAGIDNYCGVPHSCMSTKEVTGPDFPEGAWWEDTYHEGFINWINAEDNAHATLPNNFGYTQQWNLKRNQCVFLNVMEPPENLVADVPSLLKVALTVAASDATETVKNNILDSISQLSGVPRGVLELSIKSGGFSSFSRRRMEDDDTVTSVEFGVFLTNTAARIMTSLLEHGIIQSIANYTADYIELGGVQYNATNNTLCSEQQIVVRRGEESADGLNWSEVLLIILLILNVACATIVCIQYRKQKQNDQDLNVNLL